MLPGGERSPLPGGGTAPLPGLAGELCPAGGAGGLLRWGLQEEQGKVKRPIRAEIRGEGARKGVGALRRQRSEPWQHGLFTFTQVPFRPPITGIQ